MRAWKACAFEFQVTRHSSHRSSNYVSIGWKDCLHYVSFCSMLLTFSCSAGFLRLKDPLKSISSEKLSAPSPASLLTQTLRLCRENKRSEDDPKLNFARELHCDLETVYVGQLCLSWEFLHWQYEKALDLWEADPYNLRRYNEVTNEFQRLQVMMQRFLENEQFEGPRVQHFVKTRCSQRNLLQVPVIRGELGHCFLKLYNHWLYILLGSK